MLECKLFYETICCEEDLKPIQDALLAGIPWSNINCDIFDSGIETDEAVVDLAIKLGWNASEYIDENLVEMMYQYIAYDGEYTTSAARLLVNEALEYIVMNGAITSDIYPYVLVHNEGFHFKSLRKFSTYVEAYQVMHNEIISIIGTDIDSSQGYSFDDSICDYAEVEGKKWFLFKV